MRPCPAYRYVACGWWCSERVSVEQGVPVLIVKEMGWRPAVRLLASRIGKKMIVSAGCVRKVYVLAHSL